MENKKQEVTTENVALSSPWMTTYKKLVALFNADPDLNVLYDDATKTVTIESVNTYKIMALEKILKPSITFGNVTLNIKCLVKNGEEESLAALFKTAFTGNPHFSVVEERTLLGAVKETYLLFQPEVLQFFNDDCTDYYGNWNGLSEDILRDVMKDNIRINVGTDVLPDLSVE